MKDSDTKILKAFLFALAEQSSPLSHDLQAQLNKIGKNLNLNIENIRSIARQNPEFSIPYDKAREFLLNPSQERNKGLASIPDDSNEKQNAESGVIENTSRLQENTNPEKFLRKLEKIDDQTLAAKTTFILGSNDPVATANEFLVNLPL